MDGIPVIDEVVPDYNATSHLVTFGARSKTADLVDCSAVLDSGQLINTDLETVVRKILAPFKIKLVLSTVQGRLAVPDFQLQPGETAASAITRLCQMHSLVYFDNGQGDLVLAKITLGQAVDTIVHKVGQ